MNIAQELLERNLEEFTQLALLAIVRKAGGKISLSGHEMALMLKHTLDVAVGAAGVTFTVKEGLDTQAMRDYFDKQPKKASSGRLAVHPTPQA